jgi:hypothetical protein
MPKVSKTNLTNTIYVYPDPNNGTFSISNLQGANGKLTITDIMGNEVYLQAYSQLPTANCPLQIYLPQLSNGVYFWEMIDTNGIVGKGKMVVIK